MPGGEWHETAQQRGSDGRYSDDKVSLREFLETISNARWKSHDEQHIAEQKAITLAAEIVERWKADSNEWRGTLNDRDAAYAKVGDVGGLETRLRVIEAAEIQRGATERERLINETKDKADADRRATAAQTEADRRWARQLQLLGILLGIPSFIGAVAGVIALVRG